MRAYSLLTAAAAQSTHLGLSIMRTSVQVFRDSARAWSCHLYAFAAPNERALAAMTALAPVLEVGAGVGYWTHLLRERGVTVVATDELPTVQCSMDTVNQYHGRVPPWTHVEQAASTCSGDYPCASLHSSSFHVPCFDTRVCEHDRRCTACGKNPPTDVRGGHQCVYCGVHMISARSSDALALQTPRR